MLENHRFTCLRWCAALAVLAQSLACAGDVSSDGVAEADGQASISAAAFGTTTVGSTCVGFLTDRKRVNPYSLSNTATISGLSAYLQPTATSGSESVQGVLYADSSGAPGVIIASTSALTFSQSNAAKWYSLPFS